MKAVGSGGFTSAGPRNWPIGCVACWPTSSAGGLPKLAASATWGKLPACPKLAALVRASLRRHKARLKDVLAQWEICTKGWEFRGARQGIARYVSRSPSTTRQRHDEPFVGHADSEAAIAGYVPAVSPEAGEGS